jgi:hypothetical protein
MRNAMMVQVQVDMRYLRPVGPTGRQHWEVQQVVPPKLQKVIGKGTLTYSTRIPVRVDSEGKPLPSPEAAAIRDVMHPQLKDRIDAARKGLEPPPLVRVQHPQQVTLGYVNGRTAAQIADVLRR